MQLGLPLYLKTKRQPTEYLQSGPVLLTAVDGIMSCNLLEQFVAISESGLQAPVFIRDLVGILKVKRPQPRLLKDRV
ncbi:MAG: hypothetical protein FRX49_12624 [Trebouxia sp. A1-2]|nr:MAG: hypothetical protein FRX49_12624 [Trebouxia sp. A1-2]